MVRLVDLDDEPMPCHLLAPETSPGTLWQGEDRPDVNHSLRLSRLLSSYPIVSQLVQYVDLNTLDELSRTCWQFRTSLLQHRKLLMRKTLRCVNESIPPSQRLGDALGASVQRWKMFGSRGPKAGRLAGGKLTNCARDLVGECRSCGDVVCRNCVIKSPNERDMKNRHRRLCRVCMKAPLHRLTTVFPVEYDPDSPTVVLHARGPCTCEKSGVWICEPCGQTFRGVDTTYLRGWAWRSRYSACGGVGAGLGEGNEGVECGRGAACLNVREIENEIECDADELAALEAEMESADHPDRRLWAGNSYMTHEIVGLGGKVKKKIKKIVLVGAIVKEYEDERLKGQVLRREQEGSNRSWCGWCSRVIPGKKDTGTSQAGESSDSVASVDSIVAKQKT